MLETVKERRRALERKVAKEGLENVEEQVQM